MCAGRYLTAKISEFPNHEIECSLSDILEDNVPEKYYLSRKQAEKLLYKENPTQGERIYSSKGLSCTLTSGSGGFGGHSGLYLIEDTENFGLPIVISLVLMVISVLVWNKGIIAYESAGS